MVVLKADKGNASVILDWEVYHIKFTTVLEDVSFQLIRKDPVSKMEWKIMELIKATDWDEKIKTGFDFFICVPCYMVY